MKYLKKSAEVLIGKAGGQSEASQFYYNVADYTAMVAMTTNSCDGLDEEFSGVCVTHEQLKQIRKAIDDYLSKTDDNAPVSEKVGSVNKFSLKSAISKRWGQDNPLKDPVNSFNLKSEISKKEAADAIFGTVNELMSEVTTSKNTNGVWEAKIVHGRNGSNILTSLGDTETEARTKLYQLIETWKDQLFPHRSSDELRIPNIVKENEQSVNSAQKRKIKPLLRVDLSKAMSKKTEEGWEARIVYWNGCNIELTAFGSTEFEAKAELYKEMAVKLQNQLVSLFSAENEPKDSKQTNETDETDDKDATQFKLNPSRVMSTKVGVDKWEARTRLCNGMNFELVDLVATADSEEIARWNLDKKFSDFAKGMTNFIKFMSQDS